MPRPSSPMGECIGILTSQTDLEITYTSSGCCSSVLHHLFLALDYLHTGTYSYVRFYFSFFLINAMDIKADNIMFSIDDDI